MITKEKKVLESHTSEKWRNIQQQRDEINQKAIEIYPQTLLEKIDKYNGIYNKKFKEYLEALVTLDIDILKDTTYNKEQIELLKQNMLFRKAINYNALTVSKKLLLNIDDDIVVEGNCLLGYLYAKNKNSNSKLFDIIFLQETLEYINRISIEFLKNEDEPEKRKNKIEELYQRFDKEDSLKNPNATRESMQSRRIQVGGINIPVTCAYDEWEKEHVSKLEEIDRQLRHLESTDGLTEEQKNSNELSKKIYKVFENEYGPFNESNKVDRKNHECNGIQLVKVNNNVKFIKKIKYYY